MQRGGVLRTWRQPGHVIALAVLVAGTTTILAAHAQSRTADRPKHVVLVTLDGARPEEIFGGLDAVALASTTKDGAIATTGAYRKYFAETPEARRERLMPFVWESLLRKAGSIAGNRARGSAFGVRNTKRFSYPGYAELLTGAPHDADITSNDNRRYPFPTVLEFLVSRWSRPHSVAVFGSWETFRWISAHEDGAVEANAGYAAFQSPDARVQALNDAQFEATTPWQSARHDAFTFRFAMDYLRRERPRALYVAFDETDDWAHDQNYERVLDALHRTDDYLRELHAWLQADPEYRDTTSIIVTVDHGRGHRADDWSKHGDDVVGADETWMIAAGPDWPRRGEWTNAPPAYSSQVAATMAKAVGEDFRTLVPDAAPPIDYLWQAP
jgi:hypothetical protein